MSIIVQKFGGTSVANTTRIKDILPIIKLEKQYGNKLIIVVSAMAGVTNHLVTLCNEVSSLKTNSALAEYDTALCSGEMVTASLLALSLHEENIPARSVLAWQLPIITNDNFSKAIVENCSIDLIIKCLDNNIIPIIAGFQGITINNRLTTLGRGGSDTTAALIAAAIKADRCDIYTDVEGVFTADPRIIPRAKKLTNISFEEMQELASSGAKVLHPRSLEIAIRYKIPIRVLSSFSYNTIVNSKQVSARNDETKPKHNKKAMSDNIITPSINHTLKENIGTLITSKDKIMENRQITGITSNKNLLRLTVNSNINFNQICNLIADNNIHLELMENIETNKQYSFIAALYDKNKLQHLLDTLKKEKQINSFTIDTQISIVSIIGYSIKNDCKLVSLILTELEKNNILVKMVQISEIKIALLIKDTDTERTIRCLHQLLIGNS
ncbi:MAG: aspartate kinase [Rickettsia endosymbiont of Bryobia graminum]|nr:aspartate kinase [Rickettsia endosymbiont of Bryobia graminum]